MTGLTRIAQIVLAALVLSLLTFAGSFAEVPRSTFVPVAASQN